LTDPKNLLVTIQAAVERSIADANAGRVTPAEEVFARLSAKYRAAAAASDIGVVRKPEASGE